jgi:hypothetical protein
MINPKADCRKNHFYPPITQTQRPTHRGQLAQPLALLCLIYPVWIMPKGMPTATTIISINHYFFDLWIAELLAPTSPTLQDVISAGSAFFWPILGFRLDIWKFQDNNRYGDLGLMVV